MIIFRKLNTTNGYKPNINYIKTKKPPQGYPYGGHIYSIN